MMKLDINELTVGQARELAELFGGVSEKPDILSHLIGEKVIIRDNRAGVFCTTLVDVRGEQWRGAESRKIHWWEKAGAVEGISNTGIDLDNSRITEKTMEANGQDLIQICICRNDVYDQIMGAKAWNPK